jgi:serine/threonine-protein kinase
VEVPQQTQIIAGRYQLESSIGEGGMASVWRARDLTLERAVAVKLLFARDERDKQNLVRQFVREARIAASVHHRNVIQIVDFGTTDGEQPFMVMELLEGETLGQRLQREPPLSLAEIVQIASLTLRGLAAVHEAGIIHRDLKPENVFLARDGSNRLFPKILDFGISRSVEPRSGRRSALTTREGMIVGTPEYMSPEQARGLRNIDNRTDLYSMGAILYLALTGKMAFSSENVGDLIIQIVTGTAPTVQELRPETPTALSEVVAKAMARAPEDRFADATSMQQALLSAAQGSIDARSLLTLSDQPPPPERAPPQEPRLSGERLRTLEFAMGEPAGLAAPKPASELPPPSTPPAQVVAPPPALVQRRVAARGWVATGLVLALLLGAALLLGRWPTATVPASRPTATAKAEPATTLQPTPAVAEPGAGSTISVSLHNVPKNALVFVDGAPASGDTLELPRDGRNRAIKVTAPGKVPWQAVYHASADASYDVALVDSDTRPAQSHAARPIETHATAGTAKKTHKKPPSALRRLDF